MTPSSRLHVHVTPTAMLALAVGSLFAAGAQGPGGSRSQDGAAPPAAVARVNVSRSGLAVKGYDVVAYFTDGRPREGSADLAVEWQGATWRFASAEHRDLFRAAPEKYAPQYGGFCAYAVSHNYTADIDPKAWSIVGGRLFLNYSVGVRERWLADRDANIAKGDANWPALARMK